MHVTENSAARGQNSILQRIEFARILLYGAYYDSPPNPWDLWECLSGNRNRHCASFSYCTSVHFTTILLPVGITMWSVVGAIVDEYENECGVVPTENSAETFPKARRVDCPDLTI